MLIGSAIGMGLSGMMRGINKVNSAGAAIAQGGIELDAANTTKSMIDQKIGELEVKV